MHRFRRCWQRRGCTIISSAAAHGAARESCWNPANRERCIISRCSSATVAARSIPTSLTETIADLIREGLLQNTEYKKAVNKFVKAAIKGVVKTMAKMGISTVQSYRGAQIFEAVGLNSEVVEKYFTWTPSRIEGVGLKVIADEALARHHRAFPREAVNAELEAGGQYQWRDTGEYHLFNPQTIHKLQNACRLGSEKIYREYAELVNNQAKNLCTLRGLLDFKFAEQPLPIEEVESVESVVKRFKTGAMSYGSISKEAHETLAKICDEPTGWKIEHRRRRRRSGALCSRTKRGLKEFCDQAGGQRRFGVTSY